MFCFKTVGKKFIAGAGILILLGLSGGCSQAEKLSWERLKATHYRMITGKTYNSKAKIEGQALAAAGHKVVVANNKKSTVDKSDKKSAEKVEVTLYFADKNGDYLRPEKRTIQMAPGLARAAVNELIKGPKSEDLTATMPEGTKVKDIDIRNGLCRIDLSREFRDNHWGGSSGEILTVYSLVDTLTQFSTVQKVEILIDGQKIDTLKGHMDLYAPVFRNSQIIKKS